MAEYVERMGEMRNAYEILVGKRKGKVPVGRPRRRWEYSIKMGFMETGLKDMDWIHMAQDRDRWRPLVYTVINLVP
jgi:hypothetical protein